ncbi:hypothetical protein R9C00_28560 [Flammeovirgaceae bacterium SG7u.111]|nr:hypothetical protein [Flammeovirgaceae bacterium SG7u.132]WPO35654.1 hypothetical protein R9C00_28560 [Flammeovirgaceae bacterium SG7u.111]
MNNYSSFSTIRRYNWQHRTLAILKLAAFLMFAGRAWQHLFWDAPFRVLLWDQELMESLVGMPWEEYLKSEEINQQIDAIIKVFGGFYAICALVVLFIKQVSKRVGKVLLLGSLSLLFLFVLGWKAKDYQVVQLFEHAVQFMTPIFLYLVVFKKSEPANLAKPVRITVAITFICHGLYALGFPYPQPGNFIDMTMRILGCDQEMASYFLMAAGVLDLIVSLMIFFPPRISNPALLYAVIWGFLTALARTVAYYDAGDIMTSLSQWVFQTAVRVPHALLPALVFFWQTPKIK